MYKYHMRKQEKQINDSNKLVEVLGKCKYAVIALCRNNEPYIVTLSYGYDASRNALYFHTGLIGLKLDFIRSNPKVCATVIDDKGYVRNDCGHRFASVVLFGKITLVEAVEEKIYGMEVILKQLEENPGIIKEKALQNESMYNRILVMRLDIDGMTGKNGRTERRDIP